MVAKVKEKINISIEMCSVNKLNYRTLSTCYARMRGSIKHERTYHITSRLCVCVCVCSLGSAPSSFTNDGCQISAHDSVKETLIVCAGFLLNHPYEITYPRTSLHGFWFVLVMEDVSYEIWKMEMKQLCRLVQAPINSTMYNFIWNYRVDHQSLLGSLEHLNTVTMTLRLNVLSAR